MKVSVVVCTHEYARSGHFREAIQTIKAQTYDNVEIIAVSDGDERVCNALHQDYAPIDSVRVVCNDENCGLLESRNRGAKRATGDVVAFMDDDALAHEEWVEQLVRGYETQDTDAVGGKMVPEWRGNEIPWLPEEFYWLIGATHRGFATEAGYVRNTMGSNLSFRRETFCKLGGFNEEMGGRKGDAHLQGGETELCARLEKGVYYQPDAVVRHKILAHRTQLRWLLNRAFWQGYSKRAMSQMTPDSTGTEQSFLADLLLRYGPERVSQCVRQPSRSTVGKALSLYLFTVVVGLGFMYGVIQYR